MTTLPKVVILGAGSAVFGLKALASIIRSERLRGLELWLVDIDEPALDLMTQLAEKMNRAWGAEMSINSTTDRRAALPKADFVVVLYNPLSREGDWRIKRAVDILTRYKGDATPVGIVTNATRKGERAQITTLGEVLNHKIVTETTVIIGNSETFVFGGRMVTPRRYETGLGY